MFEEVSMTLEEFQQIKPGDVLARHPNGTVIGDKTVSNHS